MAFGFDGLKIIKTNFTLVFSPRDAENGVHYNLEYLR